jgi:hypothetical protein
MNERAEEALARLLDLAVDGIEGAKTFAEAELPQVVEQLLMWKFWKSLLHMLLSTGLFALSLGALLACIVKINRSKQSQDEDGQIPYCTNFWWGSHSVSGPASAISLGLAATTFLSLNVMVFSIDLTWLQILIAPKLYLLEYSAGLAK